MGEVTEFFRALVNAQWRTTALFTSRFACDLFDEVPRGNWVDVPLPGLNQRQALMLMNNLPRLRNAPLADKLAAWNKVGGHPKTIELLEGFLADYSLRQVLENETIQTQLTEEWERYFMGALLARLNDAERHALTTTGIFQGALDRAMLAHCGANETMAARWHNLSLIQREADARDGTARYSLHPVVRGFLLGRLSDDERRRLHLHAASLYQERILAPYRDQIKPEHLKDEASAARQVLRQLVQQTQDMDLARGAMELGIAWRAHLFAAGQYEEAGAIVTAVHDILARWGQRDLAKGLLRESIATREGFGKAVAQGNLATLLKDEGRLDEALATYEEVYCTFESLSAKQQMAAVLAQISSVYMNKGDYDQAIAKQEASLTIKREFGDEEGQAISLHQLSIPYMLKGDYSSALSRSQEAERIDRKRGDDAGLAADLHEQGLILNGMSRPQEAFARFQESLEMSRRVGDEAGTADELGEIGKLLRDAGQMREAIAAFSQCLEIHRQLDDPAKLGIDLEMLGSVHERQGQYAAALEKYEEALGLARQFSSPQDVAIVEQHIARVKGKMSGT